jgi:hypothetical protein
VHPEYPILWLAAGRQIVCSASGHALTVPAHPNVTKLLRRLNTGEPCRMQELLERYSGTVRRGGIEFAASQRDIRFLLEKLYSFGAIKSITTEEEKSDMAKSANAKTTKKRVIKDLSRKVSKKEQQEVKGGTVPPIAGGRLPTR